MDLKDAQEHGRMHAKRHPWTHARMHTRTCTQTRSALREQEQTAWASRMKSRMQGVEAMLDQVFLAASYGLGGDTPFTWPLAGATGGWRVPTVHGLAGHPSTGITEVLAPKWRCPGCRTRHGMLLVYGIHHWNFLFSSSHVPVTLHAWHDAARRGSERLRSSTRAPKHSERGLVHARTHARTPARTHVTKQVARIEPIVLRAKATSANADGQQEHAPQQYHRIHGLAGTAARPTATAQVLVSDSV